MDRHTLYMHRKNTSQKKAKDERDSYIYDDSELFGAPHDRHKHQPGNVVRGRCARVHDVVREQVKRFQGSALAASGQRQNQQQLSSARVRRIQALRVGYCFVGSALSPRGV
jgi:hypothetical protein